MLLSVSEFKASGLSCRAQNLGQALETCSLNPQAIKFNRTHMGAGIGFPKPVVAAEDVLAMDTHIGEFVIRFRLHGVCWSALIYGPRRLFIQTLYSTLALKSEARELSILQLPKARPSNPPFGWGV